MRKFLTALKVIVAVSVAAFFIASCANPLTDIDSRTDASARTVLPTDPTPPNALSFDLTAGQTHLAGTVYVWKDADNLYIKYVVSNDYPAQLAEVQALVRSAPFVDPSPSDLSPGSFPYKQTVSPASKIALLTIPISGIGFSIENTIYIYAHAHLTDENTAWGGTITGAGGGKWYGTIPVIPPMGESQTYSISGYVFHDVNNNGVFDAGETGLAGVTVTLSTGATTTTAADGSYSFTGLAAGTYTVTSGGLTGYFATPYSTPVTSRPVTLPESQTGVNFGLSYETIQGVAFFDSNKDGDYQAGEPLLSGVTITLGTGATTTSASDGSYSFTNLQGDQTYSVTAADLAGFLHSNPASRSITLGTVYGVPKTADFGYTLDYSWISGQTANGLTIGFWKNNIDKAIANVTKGTQVSKETILGYIAQLSDFILPPLNVTTLGQASAILGSTSSAPADLLAKQLIASELNYAAGAYIGGNQLVTYFFLYDGEYMLANPGSFTSAQLLAQQARYDSYNNSHGDPFYF